MAASGSGTTNVGSLVVIGRWSSATKVATAPAAAAAGLNSCPSRSPRNGTNNIPGFNRRESNATPVATCEPTVSESGWAFTTRAISANVIFIINSTPILQLHLVFQQDDKHFSIKITEQFAITTGSSCLKTRNCPATGSFFSARFFLDFYRDLATIDSFAALKLAYRVYAPSHPEKYHPE